MDTNFVTGLPITLENAFALPDDNRIQIARLGEFPHEDEGVTQIVDPAALEAILADFNVRRAVAGSDWAGILIDQDHFSLMQDKPSTAMGWIVHLDIANGVLWATVRWTAAGRAAAEGGQYRFCSPVWRRGDCDELGGGRVRPLRLYNAALTNAPNIKGLKPISNREAPPAPEPAKETMISNRVARLAADGIVFANAFTTDRSRRAFFARLHGAPAAAGPLEQARPGQPAPSAVAAAVQNPGTNAPAQPGTVSREVPGAIGQPSPFPDGTTIKPNPGGGLIVTPPYQVGIPEAKQPKPYILKPGDVVPGAPITTPENPGRTVPQPGSNFEGPLPGPGPRTPPAQPANGDGNLEKMPTTDPPGFKLPSPTNPWPNLKPRPPGSRKWGQDDGTPHVDWEGPGNPSWEAKHPELDPGEEKPAAGAAPAPAPAPQPAPQPAPGMRTTLPVAAPVSDNGKLATPASIQGVATAPATATPAVPIAGSYNDLATGNRTWGQAKPGVTYPAGDGIGNPAWEAAHPELRPKPTLIETMRALAMHRTLPNRAPMSDDQRKAMFARMAFGGSRPRAGASVDSDPFKDPLDARRERLDALRKQSEAHPETTEQTRVRIDSAYAAEHASSPEQLAAWLQIIEAGETPEGMYPGGGATSDLTPFDAPIAAVLGDIEQGLTPALGEKGAALAALGLGMFIPVPGGKAGAGRILKGAEGALADEAGLAYAIPSVAKQAQRLAEAGSTFEMKQIASTLSDDALFAVARSKSGSAAELRAAADELAARNSPAAAAADLWATKVEQAADTVAADVAKAARKKTAKVGLLDGNEEIPFRPVGPDDSKMLKGFAETPDTPAAEFGLDHPGTIREATLDLARSRLTPAQQKRVQIEAEQRARYSAPEPDPTAAAIKAKITTPGYKSPGWARRSTAEELQARVADPGAHPYEKLYAQGELDHRALGVSRGSKPWPKPEPVSPERAAERRAAAAGIRADTITPEQFQALDAAASARTAHDRAVAALRKAGAETSGHPGQVMTDWGAQDVHAKVTTALQRAALGKAEPFSAMSDAELSRALSGSFRYTRTEQNQIRAALDARVIANVCRKDRKLRALANAGRRPLTHEQVAAIAWKNAHGGGSAGSPRTAAAPAPTSTNSTSPSGSAAASSAAAQGAADEAALAAGNAGTAAPAEPAAAGPGYSVPAAPYGYDTHGIPKSKPDEPAIPEGDAAAGGDAVAATDPAADPAAPADPNAPAAAGGRAGKIAAMEQEKAALQGLLQPPPPRHSFEKTDINELRARLMKEHKSPGEILAAIKQATVGNAQIDTQLKAIRRKVLQAGATAENYKAKMQLELDKLAAIDDRTAQAAQKANNTINARLATLDARIATEKSKQADDEIKQAGSQQKKDAAAAAKAAADAAKAEEKAARLAKSDTEAETKAKREQDRQAKAEAKARDTEAARQARANDPVKKNSRERSRNLAYTQAIVRGDYQLAEQIAPGADHAARRKDIEGFLSDPGNISSQDNVKGLAAALRVLQDKNPAKKKS